MQALESLGGANWFRLGDGDLALHVERTRRLGGGESLSQVIDAVRRRWNISASIVPMSDEPVRTRVVHTRGRACLPGLLRAPALRAARDCAALRRCATGQGVTGCCGGTCSGGCARGHPVSLQPLPQHGPDPRSAGPARGCAWQRRTGHRRDAARRRGCGQGTDGEDHGGAGGACDLARRSRATMQGSSTDSCSTAAMPTVPQTSTARVHVTDTLMVTMADRERLAHETLASRQPWQTGAGEHLGPGPGQGAQRRQAAPRGCPA